jgi:hypothetical protein
MFGRTLRNINKPTYINSINGRDCLVELKFRTPQRISHQAWHQTIVFEIYENGELIPIPAKLEDYQTMLETSISS